MKYKNTHLLCSGSLKYQEIYGYYEIQCPYNVSTCIEEVDTAVSSYANNGTQCGLYNQYEQCEQNCENQCLYYQGEERITMIQNVFIPNIHQQIIIIVQVILSGKQQESILILEQYVLQYLQFYQQKKTLKYYIDDEEEEVPDQYISDDVYGEKERKQKQIEEEIEKNKRQKKKND